MSQEPLEENVRLLGKLQKVSSPSIAGDHHEHLDQAQGELDKAIVELALLQQQLTTLRSQFVVRRASTEALRKFYGLVTMESASVAADSRKLADHLLRAYEEIEKAYQVWDGL